MKKVFISGVSTGIGFAIAEIFHKNGYQVGGCARNEEGLKEAANKLPGLLTFQADVSQKAEVKALAKEIQAKMGRLDMLVNNAGVFIPGMVHEEEDENYELMMRTNMDSAYYLTKALIKDMKAAKSGTIINMCSIASIMAYPNGGSYAISKFAMLGWSKSLRLEMLEHGVKVISVLPGAVYTRSWEPAGVAPERLMPAEDIAEAVWSASNMSDRTVVEEIILRPQLGDL